MKLFVIGNGFDIAHGLKTSYWDFRRYLQKYAGDFLIEFEKIYGFYPFDPDDYHLSTKNKYKALHERNNSLKKELWSDFEVNLGLPDEGEIDSICETAVDCMNDLESGPVNIEDTVNEYLQNEFSYVTKLQDYVFKWAKQIKLHRAFVKKNELFGDNQDYFLTFNYTPTLERIYKIDKERVCHIHGGIPPYCTDKPIMGHGNRKAIEEKKSLWHEYDDKGYEGDACVNKAFFDFYKNTFKDTSQIASRNIFFFVHLAWVDSVEVIGHSLSEVDLPYFKHICHIVGDKTPWTIYYHSTTDIDSIETAARSIGLGKLEIKQSDGFWDK